MKKLLLTVSTALALFLGAGAQAQSNGIQLGTATGCLYGVACKALSLSLIPSTAATLLTHQAQASGGSTLLAFSDASAPVVGQFVTGTSIPAGDQVASIVSTAQITQAANGAFLTAQKVIPMATTAGFGVGQQCTDTTKPSAIGAGNVIASIQANVSITLTSNVTAASMGGTDSITCDPVVTLVAASTATIGSGASIGFSAAGSATLGILPVPQFGPTSGLIVDFNGIAGSGLAISQRSAANAGGNLIFPDPVTNLYDGQVDIFRGDYSAGVQTLNFENYATDGGFVFAGGNMHLKFGTSLFLDDGGVLQLGKIVASGAAPGAGYVKMEAVAGTNAGTCKIIAYAGTSNTPVTIVDNVGAGC